MNATVLTMTNDMSREEWLKARRNGIGGSDAAAIAGLNKWKSPVAVYLEKTGMVEVEEVVSEAAYFGTLLEDVVAQEFSKRTGLKVRRKNAILQHPEHPFMLANIDRLIVGENVGLECKTASEYMKNEWKDDEIPAAYLLQVQHYMAVTGYEAWWIAVLIGGNKFIYKKIERDEEIIEFLINIEKDFWENHVLKQNPPMFDGSEASSSLLKTLYPTAEPDSEIELESEADVLIEALEEVSEELKQLEEKKTEYENRLKAMLGEYEKGFSNYHVITWKTVNSTKFDSKTFKKDHPDLFEKYAKQSSYRRFSIK
ncbi:YqaJ viral recombinase family nuclease [Tepidibacillus decaturensis]|uniref:YqaJ viral recombinase domain-containing protein n=1 Tax=Tepidibacillus decaturensis TaxID=1413211 RepID=A0A135L1V4_9BACI|nr:YqaJ viral recombinase family protein [Tepidibacillus decaturensis]KXG42859.1 hypothetical protein U473_01555 [Tepidibacillus decaturensis]